MNIPINNKICKTCERNLPLTSEYYHKNLSDVSGYYYKCKSCRSADNQKNREKIREYRQQYLKRPGIAENLSQKRNTCFAKRKKKLYDQYYSKKPSKRKQIRDWQTEKMKDVDWRLKNLLNHARLRANKKNIDFDIDFFWLKAEWEKQRGKCAVSGIPLNLERPKDLKKGHRDPYGPSIDRINSNFGYVKNNIRIVCVWANDCLNEHGLQKFLEFAYKCIIFNRESE